MSWETGRTPPTPNYNYGTASVQAVVYRPLCKTGPCDIAVTPDGVNGTYYPVGDPPPDSVKAKKGQPYRLQWNAATRTYESRSDRASYCQGRQSETPVLVPNGYRTKSSSSTTFTAPSKTAPAQLGGTGVITATGNAESVAKGCADYSVNFPVVAAPNQSIAPDAKQAAGTYRVTETVDAAEPAGQRPRGFVGILVPESTVTAVGKGIAVTGVLGLPATLKLTATGWTGSVSARRACARETALVPRSSTPRRPGSGSVRSR